MKVDEESTRRQSLNAYNQWKDIWRKHSKAHSKFEQKPLTDFQASGIGKAALLIANGYSFEEQIEVIKEHQGKVDIFVCDKALGHCLDHGIKPFGVILCDAVVDYEKYMEPWKDQLEDVILFSNVNANTEWTHNGNWKDKYFFVNEDVIESEKEFSKLSGCTNFIPAGTNVSNAMVVFLCQSNNKGRKNFFGYDKTLLIGFDYSWKANGNYYAFSLEGEGKRFYMKHAYLINHDGELCYTSTNLAFSASWLEKYCQTFGLPVIQCSKSGIFTTGISGKLEDHMSYLYKTEDSKEVKKAIQQRREAFSIIKQTDLCLKKIGTDHYKSFQDSV